MNRAILTSFLVLIALLLADRALQDRREAHRALTGTVRPLLDPARLAAGRVATVRIAPGNGAGPWTYRRAGGRWRYPAEFDAYVLEDRLGNLLDSILKGHATVLASHADDLARYGLDQESALSVHLADGAAAVEVRIGRSLPGQDWGESWVQIAGADTVYHLHTDPRQALGPLPAGNDAPLLDPYLLPRALSGAPPVRIDFRGAPGGVRALRRVEVRPPAGAQQGRLPPGPVYAWRADIGGRELDCNEASAGAYIAFLYRLRCRARHDPSTRAEYGFENSNTHLRLTDAEGAVDTLDIGATDPSGNVYVRRRRAGQVFTLAPEKAGLLLPGPAILLDTLAVPSPYILAEPSVP